MIKFCLETFGTTIIAVILLQQLFDLFPWHHRSWIYKSRVIVSTLVVYVIEASLEHPHKPPVLVLVQSWSNVMFIRTSLASVNTWVPRLVMTKLRSAAPLLLAPDGSMRVIGQFIALFAMLLLTMCLLMCLWALVFFVVPLIVPHG